VSERVAIIAGVYNGERFLAEQFGSLGRQTMDAIDVWVSDDGSTDGSREELAGIAAGWTKGAFTILSGPGQGFAANFRSLLVNPDIVADYVAFCDQDDVWAADKLQAAVNWLARQTPGRPALYCSRTRVVDIDGYPLGLSPLFAKPPAFRNGLVQSLAGANTMVLNLAAHALVAEASRRTEFVSHDWWTYLLVTGAGGVVHYSPQPRVDYRQHADNLVGANDTLVARMGRVSFLLGGGFARWTDLNLAGLKACEDLLTPEARDLRDRFEALRRLPLPRRLAELHRTGLYRQSRAGQASLFVAAALNRL
jgi:glycosyltransferase involved in cell wall biosynthesis